MALPDTYLGAHGADRSLRRIPDDARRTSAFYCTTALPHHIPMATVTEIFDRAERCFEKRVEEIFHGKHKKAEQNGAILNARRAKRDARAAAGKEKVEALVRRLADLAVTQERVITQHCPDADLVGQALQGVFGVQLSAIVTTASAALTDKAAPVAFREGDAVLYPLPGEAPHFKKDHCVDLQDHSEWVTLCAVRYILDKDVEFEFDSASTGSAH